MANAVLSDRQFIAERTANFTLVGPDGRPHGKPSLEEDGRIQPLRIPRRPKWTVETSKEQLESSETRAFLEWRAAIAKLEEDEKALTVTPFEKNLEVWKQLWRVVERSDIVVQIVDARNPTFFRSACSSGVEGTPFTATLFCHCCADAQTLKSTCARLIRRNSF